MSTKSPNLQTALQSLPEDAKESAVNALFVLPLLTVLGFRSDEIYSEYPTGDGNEAVDKAARKTIDGDLFLHTRSDPSLILEIKGRDVNLSADTAQYQNTVKQLKRYLLAPNCKTVQWGIITNSRYIQLFRKHGKVIFPATLCMPLNVENINDVVGAIKEKIIRPKRALTVAIYNNKGGVGKTTTTVNLAGILTLSGKKVLAVDFDPNQQDLTSSLGLPLSEGKVLTALTEKNIDLQSAICTYSFLIRKINKELKFDVIPADQQLTDTPEHLIRNVLKRHTLYRRLEELGQIYDYILVDSPPNWRVFSQQAVYAADVVLIPTKHNSRFSIENAAMAIKKFIPEVQAEKGNGSPIALPIFFNGERATPAQMTVVQKEMDKIIKTADKEDKFDLLPYFFPRWVQARKDQHVFEIPSYANIAAAAFLRTPAVYRDRSAYEYYKGLVKEYFLQ